MRLDSATCAESYETRSNSQTHRPHLVLLQNGRLLYIVYHSPNLIPFLPNIYDLNCNI